MSDTNGFLKTRHAIFTRGKIKSGSHSYKHSTMKLDQDGESRIQEKQRKGVFCQIMFGFIIGMKYETCILHLLTLVLATEVQFLLIYRCFLIPTSHDTAYIKMLQCLHEINKQPLHWAVSFSSAFWFSYLFPHSDTTQLLIVLFFLPPSNFG